MERLFEPKLGLPMKVAIFTSGNGSTVMKILEHQRELSNSGSSPFEISAIFTDNSRQDNEAFKIGTDFHLPVEVQDIYEFYVSAGKDHSDLSIRPDYFKNVVEELDSYNVDAVMLVDYMAIVTDPLLFKYGKRMFNVHHADLSIRDKDGRAKYTGKDPVKEAILDGQNELRSTTHMVVSEVDQGRPLLISDAVPVRLPGGVTLEELRDPNRAELLHNLSKKHEDELRAVGDWKICPLTLEWVAMGFFAFDDAGTLYLHDKPLRYGYEV